MYAIIETGSKQYRVQQGDTLQIELLETKEGAKSVKLDKVLLVADDKKSSVGTPYVKGAFCEAEVLGTVKAPKVISFKYIRREKAATKIGHRQRYLKVKIKSINAGA